MEIIISSQKPYKGNKCLVYATSTLWTFADLKCKALAILSLTDFPYNFSHNPFPWMDIYQTNDWLSERNHVSPSFGSSQHTNRTRAKTGPLLLYCATYIACRPDTVICHSNLFYLLSTSDTHTSPRSSLIGIIIIGRAEIATTRRSICNKAVPCRVSWSESRS